MKFFDQVEKYISYTLLGLMALIVASATLEVAYVIVTDIFIKGKTILKSGTSTAINRYTQFQIRVIFFFDQRLHLIGCRFGKTNRCTLNHFRLWCKVYLNIH